MDDWNAKVGSESITSITGNFGLGVQSKTGDKLVEFSPNSSLLMPNIFFNNLSSGFTHGHPLRGNTEIE